MSAPLRMKQTTDARPNPHAKWVCGYGSIGLGCTEGPDEKGACCQVRTDRVRPVDNATCHEECSCRHACELAKLRRVPELPSHVELGPCIPQRADWYWRQTLMLNVGILTAGLLLLCMSLPQREAIFVPGALTKKHAQLLGNHLVSERCSLCHPSSHSGIAAGTLQDELCLTCHTQHLPDATLRSPHDLPRAQLVKLTSKWKQTEAQEEPHEIRQTNCALCHIEHHGAAFDLTASSDASCQSCHQRKFPSLANGHPQFENYPYRRPRQVAFDHSAHEQKHFGTKNQKFDCGGCHVDQGKSGDLGSVFRTVGFDRACGGCHQEAIQAATVNGWALLQLPSLEPADPQSESFGLSDWPTTARFGVDGEISVPMRLLLAADVELHVALAQLPASGKLSEVSDDLQVRAAIARSLALGIHRLVTEVAAEGQAAWQRRLNTTATNALDRDLLPHEKKLIEALSQGIPPDLFRQMELKWFGNSSAIAQHESRGVARPMQLASQLMPAEQLLTDDQDSLLGDATDDDLLSQPLAEPLSSIELEIPPAGKTLTKLRGAVHVAAGGWYLDHELLALRYMPRGHADPTLAAWAEFIALIDAHTHIDEGELGQVEFGHVAERSTPHRLSNLTHGVAVPGGCTQCHLLHSELNTTEEPVRWTSWQRPQSVRQFTKFDHTPHLTLPVLTNCRYCHLFQKDRPHSLRQLFDTNSQELLVTSPSMLTHTVGKYLESEFIGMRLDQCAACHRPGAADDGCTQCHNYHVGSQGMNWSK